ncbi:MAG: ComEC family competence protein [Rickettsiales bacterium]|jgi:competence protein ComEC|nr:ComEC family competence protein [Rickettsiales bacterium]
MGKINRLPMRLLPVYNPLMNKFLSAQYQNFILWAPFAFAAGAVAYFVWPSEPFVPFPWLVSVLFAAVFLSVNVWFKQRPAGADNYRAPQKLKIFAGVFSPLQLFVVLSALSLFAFGFFYAAATSRSLATPSISHDLHDEKVAGAVERIDHTPDRVRVFIRAKNSAPIKDGTVVRLSLKQDERIPRIGAHVEATGKFFKPAPADAPSSFDMAEYAYFNGFGATGFPTKEIKILDDHASGNVSALREKIHRTVAQNGNKTAAALVDSLVLGHTNAIDREESGAAKAAGISHVFSISGFHMTLIGGWAFAFFYLLFRAFPSITMRIPARIPALVCTWAALLFYLQLSGAMVATQRAFAMATVGFAALIFARQIFSLRNVCICFGLLILINPHYVMDIGFQLSFAAIFGLTYLFADRKYEIRTRLQKIFQAVEMAILGTVIATIFTAPFIAYHFRTIQIYGLLGNLLCVPIFSIAIMPLVIIGTIAAQFGWFWPLDLGAHIYDMVMRVANSIASLPYSVIYVPRIPGVSLSLFILAALVFLFVIRDAKHEIRKTNIVIAAIILCSLLFAFGQSRPVFYATRDHELVAFMTDSGRLQFNKARAGGHKMTFGTWDGFNGDKGVIPGSASRPRDDTRKPIGKGFSGEKYSVECLDKVCVFRTPKWNLAYIQQFVPLYKNIERLCSGVIPGRHSTVRDNTIDFIASYFHIAAPGCRSRIMRGGFVIYESGRVEYVPSERVWHR